MTGSVVPIGQLHNSAAYLEIVWRPASRYDWSCGHRVAPRLVPAGFWVRRICPCHHGELVTARPVESEARAEAVKRIMVAVSEALGT